MEQLFEFASNHPLLVAAFLGTLGVLVYTEMSRVTSGVPSVSPYQATQLLNEDDAVFLDVRSDAEFRGRHIADAKHIAVSAIKDRMNEIDKFKSRKIVVYCESGMRSAKAAQVLKKNGFENTHNLAGGLGAWEKANLPLVS